MRHEGGRGGGGGAGGGRSHRKSRTQMVQQQQRSSYSEVLDEQKGCTETEQRTCKMNRQKDAVIGG